MAQYRDGTVSVTNGSTVVALAGGDAAANIEAGDWFYLTDETVDGHGVKYVVAATPTEVDEFVIAPAWQAASASAKVFAVHRDFSIAGLPIFSGNEVAFAPLLNELVAGIEAIEGGGLGGFQTFPGGFAFPGHAGKIAAVNAGETSLEPVDHRFLPGAVAELAPTALAGRLVHYSALSGTVNESAGRASQWNDISGNARHAVADVGVGPLVVGEAGQPSLGLSFESSATAADDVSMLATVPANATAMFFFFVGRLDSQHGGSRNLFKTAHNGAVDTQVAGDIEFAPASSGSTLNVKISTSAEMIQLKGIGPLKNGLPFAIGVRLNNGVLDGWAVGQGLPPLPIATTYAHGSGFNTDRLRLGQTPDDVTAHVLHELCITSTLPSLADIQRLIVWAANRYFASQRPQDQAQPRFAEPLRMTRQPIIAAYRPAIRVTSAEVREFHGQSLALSPADAMDARLDWANGVFVSESDAEFTLSLPANAALGYELDIEQAAGSEGVVTIALLTGAANGNEFPTSVLAGQRLRVWVQSNATGANAVYAGYLTGPSGGGGGVSAVKNSLEVDAAAIQLVGDAATPGANKIYGTNASGVRGYQALATLADVMAGNPAVVNAAQLMLSFGFIRPVNATADVKLIPATHGGGYCEFDNDLRIDPTWGEAEEGTAVRLVTWLVNRDTINHTIWLSDQDVTSAAPVVPWVAGASITSGVTKRGALATDGFIWLYVAAATTTDGSTAPQHITGTTGNWTAVRKLGLIDGSALGVVVPGNGGEIMLRSISNAGDAPIVRTTGDREKVNLGGRPLENFAETIWPLGSISGSVTVDPALGSIQTATLSGNVTALAFASTMPVGQTVRLDWNLASFTLADPAGSSWIGGSPPTLGTGKIVLAVTKMTTGPTYEMFFAGGGRS